jgi:hypothetical protein
VNGLTRQPVAPSITAAVGWRRSLWPAWSVPGSAPAGLSTPATRRQDRLYTPCGQRAVSAHPGVVPRPAVPRAPPTAGQGRAAVAAASTLRGRPRSGARAGAAGAAQAASSSRVPRRPVLDDDRGGHRRASRRAPPGLGHGRLVAPGEPATRGRTTRCRWHDRSVEDRG